MLEFCALNFVNDFDIHPQANKNCMEQSYFFFQFI